MTVLTVRQELILKKVVEGHLELGVPVSSKWLAESPEIEWGPSTVRSELAALEHAGLLNHPHTSAGRVPTDSGYRYYADRAIDSRLPADQRKALSLSAIEQELDNALQNVATFLSTATQLLAIVSSPPISTATIKHVEVLLLRPNVVAVVAITSAGDVSRKLITFKDDVDQGLVEWAGSYINERLSGIELGSLRIGSLLNEPALGDVEQEFVSQIGRLLGQLEGEGQATLYMEGASHLIEGGRLAGETEINSVIQLLEQRYSLLAMLRSSVSGKRPYLSIGSENEMPEFKFLSVVAAAYGLPNRELGSVSVIGPVRMDYVNAISWVRETASSLSDYVEEVYR